MDEGRLGRGQPRMGEWLGDLEDLVRHEGGDDGAEPALQFGLRWNPVTYRCAFCDETFVSRAMMRRHLERHAPPPVPPDAPAEPEDSPRDAA